MDWLNPIIDKLSSVDPLVWSVLGGFVAPYVQEALKQVREFGEKSNYVIGVLVLPGLIGAGTAVIGSMTDSGAFANLNPALVAGASAGISAVVGQLKYGLSLRPKQQLKKENEMLKSSPAKWMDAPDLPAPEPTVSEY